MPTLLLMLVFTGYLISINTFCLWMQLNCCQMTANGLQGADYKLLWDKMWGSSKHSISVCDVTSSLPVVWHHKLWLAESLTDSLLCNSMSLTPGACWDMRRWLRSFRKDNSPVTMTTNELTLRHTSRLLIQIRPRPQVCDVTGTREILMAVQMEAVMKRCYITGEMEGERCEIAAP